MKITKEKQITENREVVVKIICNKCGKEHSPFDEFDYNTFQSLAINFGYGSRFDGHWWLFDICEDCFSDFIKTFKIKPEGYDSYL